MSTAHTSASLTRRGLLGIAGSAALAASACSMQPATPSEHGNGGRGRGDGGTFTWYTSNNHVYDTWKGVVAQFEKDHGVTVKWQKFKWADMQVKLQADFAAGTTPDLVEYSGGDNTMQFVLSDDVLPLDPYIETDGADMGYPDDWQKSAVETWQHEDQTYGIQLQLTCIQLYYNKAMLADAGIDAPPDNWDDLISAAKELTRDGVDGVALNPAVGNIQPWLLQAGATLYDQGSKEFLAPHDAAIEALQFQSGLAHKYKVASVPSNAAENFASRKLLAAKRAAMIFTGPWDIKPITTAAPDIELGIGLPLKHAERSTILAGSGVFIPKKSQHPDLAWDMIKRLTSLETELALTKEAGQTMPRKSWAKSEQIAGDPQLAAMAAGIEHATDWGQPLATTGTLAAVNAALETLYQNVLLRNRPAVDELATFVEAAKSAR